VRLVVVNDINDDITLHVNDRCSSNSSVDSVVTLDDSTDVSGGLFRPQLSVGDE
jgi:hypothetical protein